MKSAKARYSENKREIRRLQLRLSTGGGRNAGATESALDRRLELDRVLLAELADGEDRADAEAFARGRGEDPEAPSLDTILDYNAQFAPRGRRSR